MPENIDIRSALVGAGAVILLLGLSYLLGLLSWLWRPAPDSYCCSEDAQESEDDDTIEGIVANVSHANAKSTMLVTSKTSEGFSAIYELSVSYDSTFTLIKPGDSVRLALMYDHLGHYEATLLDWRAELGDKSVTSIDEN